MSGFGNNREVVLAEDSGRYLYASFRKQATQTTGAGVWFDLSMSPGNPAPNYYIGSPGEFTVLAQSTDGGLRHGGAVNTLGYKKHIRKLMAFTTTSTAVPLPMKLLDYLGFYPFIDESILDEQFMDNTTTLSRYTDGKGVQLMPVTVAGHTGGQTFTVNYTNSAGVSGRVTQAARMSTQFVNGTILHSQQAGSTYPNNGPFLPLQIGDSGVRSVESVTIGGVGDVGLFALALVKPLATFALRGVDAAVETDFLIDNSVMPEIVDDAYLNFISLPQGTLSAAPIHGILETTWN
jgi:hypothetical protein